MCILNALCERFVQLLTTIWGWKTFNLVMRSAKNFSPLATYPTSSPKRVVKSQTFLGFEIDNFGFTVWICIFTLWKWTYLFEIDNFGFTLWICIFTLWKWTYLFEIHNPGFTVWICIFTLWIRGYLFQIDKSIFTVWICIFTLWIGGYLFQIREKFGTSRHISEMMWGR